MYIGRQPIPSLSTSQQSGQIPRHGPLSQMQQEQFFPRFLQQQQLIVFAQCLERRQTSYPAYRHKQQPSGCFLQKNMKEKKKLNFMQMQYARTMVGVEGNRVGFSGSQLRTLRSQNEYGEVKWEYPYF